MRTLQLFLAFFLLSLVQVTHAVQSTAVPASFFEVTLPFEREPNQTEQALFDEQIKQAMSLLLLRLTGQPRFVESGVGQRYIQQANGWLTNFNVKPRFEDGVEVGKNIAYRFDANRLTQAFVKQYVKLWPLAERPKTLVMGSFVQQGRLQKLKSELLDYRLDIDFRGFLEKIELPYYVPETDENWIFPVEPEATRTLIQQHLMANTQQNLLSFKVLTHNTEPQANTNENKTKEIAEVSGVKAKAKHRYTLEWYLFALSGATKQKAILNGDDLQSLMQQMFSTVAQIYVKQGAVKAVKKNHILLNVSFINSAENIAQLEKALQAQQPMIRKAQLQQLKGTTAQYDIEYQGDLTDVLNWLENWPLVVFVGETADKTISVNMK